jgi:hypothetical protein
MTEAARPARSMNVKIKGVAQFKQQIRGYHIADFDRLQCPDLLSQLIANPTLFHQFFLSH